MAGLSLLKAGATAILLVTGVVQAAPGSSILQQPFDSLGSTQQVFGHGLARPWTNAPAEENRIGETPPWPPYEAQKQPNTDGFLKAFSHPAFPEYSMRYKTPEICDPSVSQVSGYLDLIEEDKHFFFWFFESRNKPKEDPVILWLEGGPACSSLLGLFVTMGPCLVNKDGTETTLNKYSWNNNASLLYVDQPLNTGYSYGENGALDSTANAKDMYAFLQLFFATFPEYAGVDFHLAGHSYGGHWVPAVGGEIHRRNKDLSDSMAMGSLTSSLLPIPLKSLMIGNGLTDPLIQYKYFPMMACHNSYGPVFDQAKCDSMDAMYPACAELTEKCYQSQDMFSCMPALEKCNNDLVMPYLDIGKSMYDVRLDCDPNTNCYDVIDGMQLYLGRADVMEALGARKTDNFTNCNDELHEQIAVRDWMRPLVNEIPPLLEDGIRVLAYAGDADFICNWMGIKAWMLELPWSGHDEFLIAKDTPWFSPTADEQGGEIRRTMDGRFVFLRVYDAGHVVPLDHGDYGFDMFIQWMQQELA